MVIITKKYLCKNPSLYLKLQQIFKSLNIVENNILDEESIKNNITVFKAFEDFILKHLKSR